MGENRRLMNTPAVSRVDKSTLMYTRTLLKEDSRERKKSAKKQPKEKVTFQVQQQQQIKSSKKLNNTKNVWCESESLHTKHD